MNIMSERRRDRVTALLSVLVAICPAVVFASSSSLWQWAVLALPLAAVSLVMRPALKFSAFRWLIAGILAAAAMTSASKLLPITDVAYYPLDPRTFLPSLLGMCMPSTLFEAKRSAVLHTVAFSYVALIVAASVRLWSTAQTVTCVTVMAMQMAMTLLLLQRNASLQPCHARGSRGRGRLQTVWPVLPLLLPVVLLVILCRASLFPVYDDLSERFSRLFMIPPTSRLRSHVDLWQTVPESFRDRQDVLLRVRSDSMPGYLRSFAYDHYEKGRWRMPGKVSVTGITPVEQPEWDGERFVISRAEKQDVLPEPTTVQFAGAFWSPTLLLPADAANVALNQDSLSLDRNGIVHTTAGVGRSVKLYRAWRSDSTRDGVAQMPTNPVALAATYTNVPASIAEELDAVSVACFGRSGSQRNTTGCTSPTGSYATHAALNPPRSSS